MKLSKFKSREDEARGEWTEYAAGLRFLIAVDGNYRYQRALRVLSRPHIAKMREANDTGDIEGLELVDSLGYQAMGEAILLGWENLEDDTGSQIPYSSEKAAEILRDYPEIFRFVKRFSQRKQHDLEEVLEESEKN